MVFQRALDCAVAEFVQTATGGILIQNNLNFRKAGGYDESDLSDLADNMALFWADQIMDKLSSALALVEVRVRGLSEELDFEAFASTAIPTAGSGGAAMTPANVAYAVSLRTGFIGRSARGRVYFGGFAEEDCTASLLDADIATGLVTALNTGLPGFLPAGWQLVLVSRYHNGVKRSGDALILPITAATAPDRVLNTQRRRLQRLE